MDLDRGAQRPGDSPLPVTMNRWSTVPRSAVLAGLVQIVLLTAIAAGQAPADDQPERVETLVLYAHELEHQPAREALPLVEPMLSPNGTLELRSSTNTLVLRDHPSAIERIRAALRDFDHPPLDLQLDLYILRASRRSEELPPGADLSALPPALVAGLGSMVRFNEYALLAEQSLRMREGQEVLVEVGNRYTVSFKAGTVLGAQVIKLRGFSVERKSELLRQRLFNTDLNLKLRRFQVVSIASDVNSASGLVVALACRPLGSVGGVKIDVGDE